MSALVHDRPLPDVTFVSAADQTYSRCLHQLLLSAVRHGYRAGFRWIAYDVGMTPATRARLEARFPWCEFRTVDLKTLPPHFAPKRGSYAWKPWVVWDVLDTTAGLVCWMDSANIIRGSLEPMFRHAVAKGVYILSGQSAMVHHCDPLVMAKAGMPRRYYGSRELVTGLLCFDAANPVIRGLVRDWHEKAFDEDSIRPARLTTPKHKNDQSLLSCLLFAAAERGEIELAVFDVDISSPRPVSFLSTRNKMPSGMPAWADPFVRAYYATAKYLDQRLHRIDRWLSGMDVLRWRKERFAVFTRMAGGAEHRLAAPWHHYYADPFLVEQEGRRCLFVEDYAYLARRATIAVADLDGVVVGRVRTVIDTGSHASFPFVFAHGSQLLMVPETCREGGVDLYVCERYPDRWRKRRRLLDGIDAADTVVFQHAGRWWLITSIASPNSGAALRYLAVFHAEDPVSGDWVPHPVNTQALYMDRPHGTGRNAGAVIERDGRLFRPMQQSASFYGEGAAMMEIVELSTEHFREVPAGQPYPLQDIVGRRGVHHVHQVAGVECWDLRVVHP